MKGGEFYKRIGGNPQNCLAGDTLRNYNNSEHNTLRDRAWQSTGGVTETCEQTDVNFHLTSLGVTYVKNAEFLSYCWLYTPGLPLQMNDNILKSFQKI